VLCGLTGTFAISHAPQTSETANAAPYFRNGNFLGSSRSLPARSEVKALLQRETARHWRGAQRVAATGAVVARAVSKARSHFSTPLDRSPIGDVRAAANAPR